MSISLPFIRVFFTLICVLFFSAYSTLLLTETMTIMGLFLGALGGVLFSLLLMGLELLIKDVNLRSFNVVALGLFFGYLMGEAIMLLFNAILDSAAISITTPQLSFVRLLVFLFSAYFALMIVMKKSEELYVSLPFIKLKAENHKNKELLLDISVLHDTRIIDLAASGLLDNYLMLPKFIVKELNNMNENGDESAKAKARKCLESVKKLETISGLEMQYCDIDYSELNDSYAKLTRLARFNNANILSADLNRFQQGTYNGVRIINIHALANALKPITQNGEFINIKIQRYGKEPRQGVGYLEDGTMVVVNGGAEFIGDTIKAQVLSVKHTSSGRMIFCNTVEELLFQQQNGSSDEEAEGTHKSYFAL